MCDPCPFSFEAGNKPVYIWHDFCHKFIIADVPEGCVIIREHIPISNLFTCLWFNEVDRFTPRDQISFSTVRDKIRSRTSWNVEMFLDCERRNFVVQVILEAESFFFFHIHSWTLDITFILVLEFIFIYSPSSRGTIEIFLNTWLLLLLLHLH